MTVHGETQCFIILSMIIVFCFYWCITFHHDTISMFIGTSKRRQNIEDQAHNHKLQHKASQQGFGISIKDIPVAFLILLKNPAFVCQCIIGACEGLLLSGMSTFLPKFVANQFYQKASFSSILTGKPGVMVLEKITPKHLFLAAMSVIFIIGWLYSEFLCEKQDIFVGL